MLEHVGAYHAVESFLRQPAVRLVARVITPDFIDVPEIQNPIPFACAGQRNALGFVLHPLAATVIEYRHGVRLLDQLLDAPEMGHEAHPRVGRFRRKPEKFLALGVHPPIELHQLAITRTRLFSAERHSGIPG